MTNRKKLLLATGATFSVLLLLAIAGGRIVYRENFSIESVGKDLRDTFPDLFQSVRETLLNSGSENLKVAAELDIPLITIKLSRNDIAHFSNLYSGLSDPNYGANYYSRHNKWRKAKVVYGNKEFRAKIRSHGRSPTDHSEGRYISLAIKLPKGETISSYNRFSLIVRRRIYPNRLLNLALAKHLNILHQPEQLVRVKIGRWKEKYFYFEPRFDNDFMEVSGKAPLRRLENLLPNGNEHKSLTLLSTGYEPKKLKTYLVRALLMEQVPAKYHAPIIEKYVALNEAIRSIDSANITRLFDPTYLAKYDALRLVGGFEGHGWLAGNFFNYYNQADGKFYPAITRDNKPSYIKLTGGQAPEQILNKFYYATSVAHDYEYSFFKAISLNDDLRQRKYEAIFQIYSNYDRDIAPIFEDIIDTDNQIFSTAILAPFLKRFQPFRTDYISRNLQTLSNYLSTSDPIVTFWRTGGTLAIQIEPRSMSGIGFDRLVLKELTPDPNKSVELKVRLVRENPNDGTTKQIASGRYSLDTNGDLDLSNFVKEITFFDGLDENLDVQSRRYLLSVQSEGIGVGDLTEEAVSVKMGNRVTGASIPSSRIHLALADKNTMNVTKIDSSVEDSPDHHDVAFYSLEEKFQDIRMSRTGDDTLVIHPGTYLIHEDFIVPGDLKVVLEAGVRLLLGEKVAFVGYNGLDVRGTKESPVYVTSIDHQKPYGTFAFLGTASSKSKIEYFIQSNGSERWVDGVFFSAGFSIHNHDEITLANSEIKGNRADDGANFKNTRRVSIYNTLFQNNFADQIDLDYANALVSNSKFENTLGGDLNGDGLDVSGSEVLVTNTTFTGFNDKGVSIGEHSQVLLYGSKLHDNAKGAAVKDLSNAYFINMDYQNNGIDIVAYRKKRIFGGGSVYVEGVPNSAQRSKMGFDGQSNLYIFENALSSGSFEPSGENVDLPSLFEELELSPHYGVDAPKLELHDD